MDSSEELLLHQSDMLKDKAVKTVLLNLVNKSLKNNPVFRDVKSEAEILKIFQELEGWHPPEYLDKNFPYYFSGYSYNGEPIWIAEAGKYDARDLANQKKEILDVVDKAFIQAIAKGVKSMVNGNSNGNVHRIRAIVDFEGISMAKVSTPAAIALILKFCSRYGDVADEVIDEVFIVNANAVVEMLVKRVRPIMGKLLKRVKIYGKNKAKWTAQIQSSFPLSAIPETYGGSLIRCESQ